MPDQSAMDIRPSLRDLAGGAALVVVLSLPGQGGVTCCVFPKVGTYGRLVPGGVLVVRDVNHVPLAMFAAGTYVARVCDPITVGYGLRPLAQEHRDAARAALDRLGE